MARITTVNKVDFLFGFRVLKQLKAVTDITDMAVMAEKFQSFGGESVDISEVIDFVSKILWVAHENACFYKRLGLDIESPDMMLFFIDEVGIKKATEIAFDGFSQMMQVEQTAPAPTKKKPSR